VSDETKDLTATPAEADLEIERRLDAVLDKSYAFERCFLDGDPRPERDTAKAAFDAARVGLLNFIGRARTAALSRERSAREEAERQLTEARADVIAAAGELLVPVPPPGTDLARLLSANVLLRRALSASRDEGERLRRVVDAAEAYVALHEPQNATRFWDESRARLDDLRAALAALGAKENDDG
jgi:hypothetical protein